MRWPFRRERLSASLDVPPPLASRAAAVDVVPQVPGSAWAHVKPIVPPTRTPPVTFRGDRFGRSVIGARAMATPSIPPLHYRADPRAPGGVLLDVASSPTIVRAPRSDATAPVAVASLPPLTHRHLRVTATAPTADLLHSHLRAAYTSFEPGRASGGGAGDESAAPVEMSWDAEHGFRQSPPRAQFRMQRRREVQGADPGASADDTDDPEGSGAPAPDALGHAELRYVPVPGPRYERPPSDLVDVIRQVTGVDVAGATIDRSPEVTDRARAMGAIAFTEGTTVNFPRELGPHDEGATRAVLAHELTHVAQQRAAGGVVPTEGSPEGIELEHQARGVQRAVDDRNPVIPLFLRSAPPAVAAPTGVQRLTGDEDRYDWQQRGAPPTQRGMRAAFGFGFMRVDPDSAAGRDDTARDREWAEQFELVHAETLQQRRDERYAEMVEEAERELRIQNLREEREGDDLLELERPDILALRRRLDQEMPWEFGPPSTIERPLYPLSPALPPDTPERSPVQRVAPLARDAAATPTSAPPAIGGDPAPDAPTIGRESLTRRVAPTPLRHPAGGVQPRGGAASELNVSWQDRPSTTREQIGAVFGGTFGQLLAGSISDADDEAERRRAEADPEIMRRRQRRERELRHAELRTLWMVARREDRSGAASLDPTAISRIRVAVDNEMPLEFVMPEYLEPEVDGSIDAEGNVGALVEQPAEPGAAVTDHDTEPSTDPIAATNTDTATTVEPVPESTSPSSAESDITDTTATSTGAVAPADGTAVALGAMTGVLAGTTEQSDEQQLAAQVFESASDLDIEQLARRLYGRFRRDLRRELLIDRERAGTLADA